MFIYVRCLLHTCRHSVFSGIHFALLVSLECSGERDSVLLLLFHIIRVFAKSFSIRIDYHTIQRIYIGNSLFGGIQCKSAVLVAVLQLKNTSCNNTILFIFLFSALT